MMQATKDRTRNDCAGPLYRPRNGRVFVKGAVCPDFVVITSVFAKNMPQMRLSEDENVIK
jgi:hypothetical protein